MRPGYSRPSHRRRGLTAALKGEITIKKARVEQSNFHDYPMLRMDEMPEVEAHVAPSREMPSVWASRARQDCAGRECSDPCYRD